MPGLYNTPELKMFDEILLASNDKLLAEVIYSRSTSDNTG